jgi:predicted transcriptional regulator of viral defense system
MTTQIPYVVTMAIKRGKELPRLEFPPTKFFHFSDEALTHGVVTHSVDDTPIRVFSPEKTLADCFKCRNKIGMDTVKEALQMYVDIGASKPCDLIQFGKICRVEKVMRPYLEVVL